MLYLFVVLLVEIIFCVVECIHARAVLVNPTFLAMIGITISTALGFIGNFYWEVQISPLLIYAIFWGFLSMFLADFISKKTTKKFQYNECFSLSQSVVSLNKLKSNIVITAVLICTVAYCIDILRAGADLGNNGLDAIYAVKRDRSGSNVLIRQGIKIVMAAMFIHTFVFVNNVIVYGRKKISEFKHLLPAACAIVCSIFTSVRTEIFRVVVVVFVCVCVLIFQNRNWRFSSLKKIITKIFPYVLLGVLLLVGLRFIVKGTENTTSNVYSVFMYIVYYLGSPIIVFGSKLNTGITNYQGEHFGELTFNRFYLLLQDYGFFTNETVQLGSPNVIIDKNNVITANVDTLFGTPCIDFGICGMALYVFILFYFLNMFYYKYIFRSKCSNKRNVKLITFSFFSAIPAMAYYTNYLSFYMTIYFLLTYVIIKLLELYYGMNNYVRIYANTKVICNNR